MSRGRTRYLAHREAARALVHELLARHNAHYKHAVRRVFIKDHRARWGSCSQRGNLNFNYRILFLPPHLQAYVVVHELCHLQHFNHSPAFWASVAQAVPGYAQCRKELRRVRIA